MRRSKECKPTIAQPASSGALVGMIDYILPEVRAAAPLAEYFMRMARAELVAAEEAAVDDRKEASGPIRASHRRDIPS